MSASPATRSAFQPLPRPSLRALTRDTRASDVCRPTLAAARCHAWPSESLAPPGASVSSPLIVEDADTTRHAPLACVKPIVTSPPPAASRPPGAWRNVTAWPVLPASVLSLTCSSPVAELSPNRARLRSSPVRSAAVAVAPSTVAPSPPPGRTSVDGVPKSFHATAAPSARAPARCAAVGAMLPVRTSRSDRPEEPWMSPAPSADAAEKSEPAIASASTASPCFRMCIPSQGRRASGGGPRRAAFIHSGRPGSRRGVRNRAREEELQRFWRQRARSGSIRRRREPAVQPLVDRRVVQQREVVRPAEVHSVLGAERDTARPAAPGGARREDERVAEEPSDRVARVAGDGRGDEAVRCAFEERDLATRGGPQRVGVEAHPVLVDERALAQVADAGA